ALTEQVPVRGKDGSVRQQTWYYPSRENCLTCHNAHTSGVLGPKTRQLNRPIPPPPGISANELTTLNHLHLLASAPSDAELTGLPALAAMDDATRSTED